MSSSKKILLGRASGHIFCLFILIQAKFLGLTHVLKQEDGPLAGSGLDPNPIQPYFDFLIDAHLTCGSRSSAILDRKVLLILLPFTFKLPLSTFFPPFANSIEFPKNFFPSMSPCVVYQNYFQRRERGVVWKIAHSPRFFLLL